MSRAFAVSALLVLAACTSQPPPAPTSTLSPDAPTTTTSFTTTTLALDSCDNVTAEVAELFADFVAELDGMSTAAFLDRRRWPERLFFLENAGVQLDARIETLGCDPATVQANALLQVGDLDPDARPALEVLRLLLGR